MEDPSFSLGQVLAGAAAALSILTVVFGSIFAAMRFSAAQSAKTQSQDDKIAHLEGRLAELKDGVNARLREQKDCLAETGAIVLRNDKEIEVLQKLVKLNHPERH